MPSSNVIDATPCFVPGTFDGQDVRLAALGNCQPGILGNAHLLATQRAAGANMSLDIAAGGVFCEPADQTLQGLYQGVIETAGNTSSTWGLTWTAADGSNPRIDLLCAEIRDSDFGGSYRGLKLRVVDGTPNASATDVALRAYWPSVPTGCTVLAAVRVPAAATTLTTANILNLNQIGGPGVNWLTGIQTFAQIGTFQPQGGKDIYLTASGSYTMPAAGVGREFVIHGRQASGLATINRSGSDTFDGATSFSIGPGDVARCIPVAANTWIVDIAYFQWAGGMYAANSGSPTHTDSVSAQKVGSGGGTLTWTSFIDIKPNGATTMVDTATNKRIDIKRAGLYHVHGCVTFASIADAKIVSTNIRQNGTAVAAISEAVGVTGAVTLPLDCILSCASGDYLELYATQNDSASEAYSVGSSYQVQIMAKWHGPSS